MRNQGQLDGTTRQKGFLSKGLPVLAVLALLLLTATGAAAQTTLSFSPSSDTVDCGETVDVEVMIDDVTDLRGYSLFIQFDENLIGVPDDGLGDPLVVIGDDFDAACGNTYFYAYDPVSGILQVDGTLLGCSMTTSDPKSLMKITFAPGTIRDTSSLDIVTSSSVMRTSGNQVIPYTYSAGSIDNICNTAPVANDDSYTVAEGGTLTATAAGSPPGVLDNDTDYDSDTLSASEITGPAHATSFTLNSNGSFSYEHDGSETTTDSFVYEANDGHGGTMQATATITITEVNDPPVAVDDGSAGTPLTTPEDTALEVAVLANDSDVDGTLDPASVLVTGGPSNGTTSVNTTTGAVTYTPTADYVGTDSFTYTVNDDDAATSNTATVYLDVTDVNDPPVAVDDGSAGTPLTTPEDTPLDVTVLGNDSDVDGTLDPASVLVTGGPSNGTTSVNTTTGVVTYTPAADYVGTDSFTYTVNDDDAATSNTATVYLDVTDVNDPPVAVDDGSAGTPLTTPEDTPLDVTVLGNDSDVDGTLDPASVLVTGGPSNGTTSVNTTTGVVTYTPTADYVGTDSFTYTVNDDDAATSNTATVYLDVTDVNDPPVAVDDGSAGTPLTTPEDTPLDVTVLGNDSDVDGTLDPASVLVTGGPSNGTTSVNTTTGVVTYTPTADYVGTDSFTYTVNDDDAATSNTATVYLDVTDVNDPPVAVDDGSAGTPLTTPEDTPLDVTVLGNDSDVDGTLDPASVLVTGGPSNGTTSVNTTTGVVTYTPAADYVGTDSFTYTVNDDDAATSNTATVYLDVTDVNDPPVAVDDGSAGTPLTTPEDTPLDVTVLGNDSDVDGTLDPASVLVTGGPSNGTTSVNTTTGVVTYTPAADYVGTDSFTYTVNDDDAATSNTATVYLDVTDVNDPPVAVDDGSAGTPLTTPEDTPLDVTVLGNDSDVDGTLDPASVLVTGGPSNGTTSVNTTTGVVTYTPAADYVGTDSFTYTVNDDDAATSNTATVYLDVTDVNDPPVAVDDGSAGTPLTTPEDTPLDVTVLGNDSDVDGTLDPASVLVTGGPSNGTTSVNTTTGVVTYTPAADYVGTDSFTYTVNDDDAATSNTATVYLDVTDVNDPPVAVDDGSAGTPLTTPEDTPLDVTVLGNDSDVDGTLDPASVLVTGGPSNGTTSVNTTTGVVTYTPAADYVGTDSFTYTVNDDDAATSNTATVYLDVTDVNDPPVAVDDGSAGTPLTTPEDTALEVAVLANDSDVDGTLDPASVLVTGGPSNGTTSVNTTTGAVTYTPTADYVGTDSFTYTVNDDDAATSNTATVYLDVTGVNDPPTVANPGAQTNTVLDPVSLQIVATDIDGDNLSYDATGLPNGLTIDVDGLISGTVECDAVTGSVTVTVTDDGEGTLETQVTFNWTVNSIAAPGILVNFTAAQKLTGNDDDGTTKINLTWDIPTDTAANVIIYRKGFGDYPEYDDGTGSIPEYPVGTWTEVATVAANLGEYDDEPATRDFWYYVAVVANSCGATSGASAMTEGALNYHLGDVSDGATAGAGDNIVSTLDVTLLGTYYATVPTVDSNFLDIGPTTDFWVLSLPTTDNIINFEDLILFAINFGVAAKTQDGPEPANRNELTVFVPETPNSEDQLEVSLWLAADGSLKGTSIPLTWNPEVVNPVSFEAGGLVAAQSGQTLALSPAPGTVDCALFGAKEDGIAGEGLLATVTFEVLTEGDANIQVGEILARDMENKAQDLEASVTFGTPEMMDIPAVSFMNDNYPNPFNPLTNFKYGVAVEGRISINIYDVRGMKVITLLDQVVRPGTYNIVWDGTDSGGRRVASGIYMARFKSVDQTQVQRMTLIK